MPKCKVCGEELDPSTGLCRRPHDNLPANDSPFLSDDNNPKRPPRRIQWVILAAVIGGLAVCGGIIVSFLLMSRETTRRTVSRQHLKIIGLALHNYHDLYRSLPPGGVFDARKSGYFGWPVSIMPHIDSAPAFNQINFKVPWSDPQNAVTFRHPLPYLLNPSIATMSDSSGYGLAHYAANENLMFANSSLRFDDMTDGLPNTIMVGEISESFLPYAQPGNWRDPATGLNAGPQTYGRPSRDGAQFLMGDGSVRWIANSVDPALLRALSTPAGGEKVDALP